jgi:2-desacetyl-2-hydroxyethyl bacteriochlorophyllide A dehydrogenase
MKAVVFRKDQGLVLEDVSIPKISADEVLVKVVNTGVCGSDHSMIKQKVMSDGYILGHEVSGIIVDEGSKKDLYPIGTRVIIRPTFCGSCHECLANRPHLCSTSRRLLGVRDLPGGFAEYIKVFPQMLIPIPDNVDSRNAALAEPAATSLHALHLTGIRGGSALVMGGGPIGLLLIRLLRLYGYDPIVLSEPVKEKREIGKMLGADLAIDPFNENLGYHVFDATDDIGFDNIFECSGVRECFQQALEFGASRSMICVVSVMYESLTIQPRVLNQKEVLITGSYSNTHEENKECLNLMAAGKLDAKPIITDLISLEDLPDIYESRIETGKATKVMLRIGDEF